MSAMPAGDLPSEKRVNQPPANADGGFKDTRMKGVKGNLQHSNNSDIIDRTYIFAEKRKFLTIPNGVTT